ncbi:MAG: hypothetical protein LUE89_09650 [Clostridiales bacterium]|nr:hypothetical protein [Clostridiales bacterium]
MPDKKTSDQNVLDKHLYIPSIDEAVNMIRRYYAQKDYQQLAVVIDYLNTQQVKNHIAGSANEFHNAGVRLTRDGFYDLAYGLLENAGIKRYPRNTDLLGDLLAYGTRCRPLTELRKWYDQLVHIPKRFWTWRAYQFAFDYLMEALPYAETEEELAEQEKEIESIFVGYKDNFRYLKDKSDREKAYMMEFEFYISKGEEDRALVALAEGVQALPGKCAQCALNYADYKFEEGCYQDAANYARIAVDVKEDQASIKLGYTYYILAMSLERLARDQNAINTANRMSEIYSAYYAAYQYMDRGREDLKTSIKRQVSVLEFDSKIPSGIDFDRLEKESGGSLSELLQLLSSKGDE